MTRQQKLAATTILALQGAAGFAIVAAAIHLANAAWMKGIVTFMLALYAVHIASGLSFTPLGLKSMNAFWRAIDERMWNDRS